VTTRLNDLRWMSLAMAVARSQLGRTAPNPAVGCVLVRDDKLVASAATDDGGRPHAERRALDLAGDNSNGTTAYVTLEPCAHHGQTPPCAQALIDAKVDRVVIACLDEDPRVAGKGIAMLRTAGIAVETGLCTAEAHPLYEGFFCRLDTGKPALYADAFDGGFDATLPALTITELDACLDKLGQTGASRVRVASDHPLALSGQLNLL